MEPPVLIDHTTTPEAARRPYTDPSDTHATMLPSLDKAAENGTWYDKRTGVKKERHAVGLHRLLYGGVAMVRTMVPA